MTWSVLLPKSACRIDTYVVRSASDFLVGGMTLAAWEAPTTISICIELDVCRDVEQSRSHLDGTVVDEKTVQLLKGLASAIRLAEGNVGNAATDRVGSVGDFHSFDRSN